MCKLCANFEEKILSKLCVNFILQWCKYWSNFVQTRYDLCGAASKVLRHAVFQSIRNHKQDEAKPMYS